jgi:hypothetical protein
MRFVSIERAGGQKTSVDGSLFRLASTKMVIYACGCCCKHVSEVVTTGDDDSVDLDTILMGHTNDEDAAGQYPSSVILVAVFVASIIFPFS